MDKKNINPAGDDTSWLDNLLASSDYGEDAIQEITGSDDDLDLEKILREAKSGSWGYGEDAEETSSAPEPAILINPVPPKPAFEDPEIAASVNL